MWTRKNRFRDTLEDIYKSSPLREKITLRLYRQIIAKVLKLMMKDMIEKGTIFRLPERFGAMGIFKTKLNPETAINWKLSTMAGEFKYQRNYHSEGYLAMFKWVKNKYGYSLYNGSIFVFQATRTNKRTLAKMIKQHNTIIKYHDAKSQ